LHQKKQIMQKCLVDALIKDIACTLVVRSALSMLFTFPCISSGHTRHSCSRQWSLWTSVQSMWVVFGINVYCLRSYMSIWLRFVYSRHFSILFDSCYRQKMFFGNLTSEMWLWIYMINLINTHSCVCVQQEKITLNLNQICHTYTRATCIFTPPCAITGTPDGYGHSSSSALHMHHCIINNAHSLKNSA
jgi:hypothetical protein